MTTAKPITVAYLIDNFIQGGGTENQLRILLQNIDRDRFRPLLITLRPASVSSLPKLDCPVLHLGLSRLISLKTIMAIRQLSHVLKEENVRILQLFFIDSNIVGALAGRLAGVKRMIIGRRDMGWWYNFWRLSITNWLNRKVDCCIANARAVKDVVARVEHIPSENIRVIYNGLEALKQESDAAIVRREIGLPPTLPIVGIVANIKPIKRIDRFLDIVEELRDTNAHFLIVGTGVQEEEMRTRVRETGLEDRVHFHSTTSQVFDVMKLFSVGLLTSETEGLSNVLIEYALAEVPALAFDTGGNGEVIVDGKTGYVVPCYDTARLAERVRSLLNDPDKIAAMGKRAREAALERFTVERMVKETEDYYLQILKSDNIRVNAQQDAET